MRITDWLKKFLKTKLGQRVVALVGTLVIAVALDIFVPPAHKLIFWVLSSALERWQTVLLFFSSAGVVTLFFIFWRHLRRHQQNLDSPIKKDDRPVEEKKEDQWSEPIWRSTTGFVFKLGLSQEPYCLACMVRWKKAPPSNPTALFEVALIDLPSCPLCRQKMLVDNNREGGVVRCFRCGYQLDFSFQKDYPIRRFLAEVKEIITSEARRELQSGGLAEIPRVDPKSLKRKTN